MKQRDTDAEGRHWAGLVGSGRKLGKGGREWRVRDREGGAHRRAEGRRRRPQEQLLELPLQVLQALPLALLLQGRMHVKSTLYEKQQPFFPNNGERVLTAGPAWLMASRMSPRISPAPCERDGKRSAGPGLPRKKKNLSLQPELAGAEFVRRRVRHRRRRCRRPRRHTGSACWGPTELLSFQLFFFKKITSLFLSCVENWRN